MEAFIMQTRKFWNKKIVGLAFLLLVGISAGLVTSPVLMNIITDDNVKGTENTDSVSTTLEDQETQVSPSISYPTSWSTGESVKITYSYERFNVDFSKIYSNCADQDDTYTEFDPFGLIYDSDNYIVKATDSDADDISGVKTFLPIKTNTLEGKLYYKAIFRAKLDNSTLLTIATYDSYYDINSNIADGNGYIYPYFEYSYYLDGFGQGYADTYLKLLTGTSEISIEYDHDEHLNSDSITNVYIQIEKMYFVANDINSFIRSDCRYTSSTVIEHRILIENDAYNTNLTITIPLPWNCTTITPDATITVSSNDIVITNTVPVTYDVRFLSGSEIMGVDGIIRQNQFLSISDTSENYLQDIGFENSKYSDDWHDTTYSGRDYTISINSSIVSQGAFSLRLESSTAYADLVYNTPTNLINSIGLYFAFDFYIESLTGASDDFQVYYYDGSWNYYEYGDYTQNRWHSVFFYIEDFASYVANDFGSFGLEMKDTGGIVFVDNFRIYKPNSELITIEYCKQRFTATLRSWDNIENPVVSNELVNATNIIRHNQTVLTTTNITTDENGQFSLIREYTSAQLQNEIQNNVTAYNSASSVSNTTKSYLQPISVEYNFDYFSNTVDFAEGTNEGFTAEYSSAYSVQDGYAEINNYNGADASEYYEFSINCDLSDYDYVEVTIIYWNYTDCGMDFLVFDDTSDYIYLTAGTSSYTEGNWDTGITRISFDDNMNQLNSDTITKLRLYQIDSGNDGSGNCYIDSIRLVKEDTVELLETSSYFYTMSTNNTFVSYASLDSNVIDESWNDLETLQRDNGTGSHTLQYIVWNDLDQENCYIPSSTYSSTYTISEASFSVSVNPPAYSDDTVYLYITANYDCTYEIYENDSSIASGNIDKDGTSISHSKNTANGINIRLSYLFTYDTQTIWYNTTYDNSEETAFSITYEFLEIGDWSAHYTIETNMDRDSVSIYLLLNGSYVQFPDSSYSAKPGSIIFSRPSYSYYNFTRIVEYDSTNYTRQTWITVTSNAQITNFNSDGLEPSSDYVLVQWNTNKGTGTLTITDNGSSIATSSIEGLYKFRKSTTEGLHQLVFSIAVESRTFTFKGNYTIDPWTATITISGDDRVDIDTNTSLTITVTRSDGGSFSGTVIINSQSVTIAAGAGTYYQYSAAVLTQSLTASSCVDNGGQSRSYTSNTFTLYFDRLSVELSYAPLNINAGEEFTLSVNITRSTDNSLPATFEYEVWDNDTRAMIVYNTNTVQIKVTIAGWHTFTVKYVQDNEEDLEEYTQKSITIYVAPGISEEKALSDSTWGLWAFFASFAIGGGVIVWAVIRNIQRESDKRKESSIFKTIGIRK